MARPGQWASFECEPTANKQFKREASAADQGVATGQFLVAKRQPQEFQSLGVHDFGFSDFQPSGREPDFLCVAPQRVMRNEIDSVEHGSGTKVTFVWPDATPPVKHKMGSSQVTVYPAFYIEHKDHDFFLHLPNLRSLASGVNVGFVDDAGHLQSVLVLGAFFSNDQRLVAAATDLTRAKHGHIRNHVFLFVADARTGRPVKYPIVAALIQPLSDNDEKQMTDDGERVYTNFYRQSSLPRSAFGKMIPDNDTNDPLSTSRLQVRRGTRNRKPPQKLEVDHSPCSSAPSEQPKKFSRPVLDQILLFFDTLQKEHPLIQISRTLAGLLGVHLEPKHCALFPVGTENDPSQIAQHASVGRVIFLRIAPEKGSVLISMSRSPCDRL
eukprot:m.367883 g.367883  ORF g.367883 m.367883 type:complete len:382 (+) comp16666_c1_seq10:1965-3110(+)